MRRRTTIRRLRESHSDPLHGVANLFDIGIVFAVGFLLALLTYLENEKLPRPFVTEIENPGQPDMEIVLDDGKKLDRYRLSEDALEGQGEKLGTAYRLSNGEVVYVPEGAGR